VIEKAKKKNIAKSLWLKTQKDGSLIAMKTAKNVNVGCSYSTYGEKSNFVDL
jgi:hypothetical protein